ncbi:hypothetical protein BST93_00285 [Nonlabens tegetincola]|uniref:DUF7507 domain-containing protein n=1 Tax=Nonlabens tegetincola TaxID=323273 RepID=UPI000CF38DDA|nr:hypothetical protein [Nonlabens tegetincola]PQJ21291.1 hypothetical protein BST93_00285 [Nonlabens tegetincola]
MPTPAYQSGGTNEDGEGDAIDLRPGASATFTAVYTINQQDINSGQVDNQAIANAVDDNEIQFQMFLMTVTMATVIQRMILPKLY